MSEYLSGQHERASCAARHQVHPRHFSLDFVYPRATCYSPLLHTATQFTSLLYLIQTYIHGKLENKTAWHNGKWILDFWIPRILQISLTVLVNLNQRSRSHDPLWNPTFDGSDSYGDKINSKMPKQSNVVHMSSYQDLILTRTYDQRIKLDQASNEQAQNREGQWSTCPFKKAGGVAWRSSAPTVHHVVYSDSINI